MSIEISVDLKAARLVATKNFLEQGSSPARVRIYGGSRPLFGAAPGSPMLVEIPLKVPTGTVSGDTYTLTTTDLATVVNTGTPTWARIVTGNGDVAIDCDAGVSGSGAAIILSDSNLYTNGKVAVISGSFT